VPPAAATLARARATHADRGAHGAATVAHLDGRRAEGAPGRVARLGRRAGAAGLGAPQALQECGQVDARHQVGSQGAGQARGLARRRRALAARPALRPAGPGDGCRPRPDWGDAALARRSPAARRQAAPHRRATGPRPPALSLRPRVRRGRASRPPARSQHAQQGARAALGQQRAWVLPASREARPVCLPPAHRVPGRALGRVGARRGTCAGSSISASCMQTCAQGRRPPPPACSPPPQPAPHRRPPLRARGWVSLPAPPHSALGWRPAGKGSGRGAT
jgi:hypothetical protein